MLPRGRPYTTSAYFWPLGSYPLTYPPYQHKYSTKRQQKGPFSRPTHPPYQPKYSTEHQPKGPFSRPTHPPFADVI